MLTLVHLYIILACYISAYITLILLLSGYVTFFNVLYFCSVQLLPFICGEIKFIYKMELRETRTSGLSPVPR